MTRLVPLSDLHLTHENWKNPRVITGLSDKDIATLAASVKTTVSPSGTKGPIDPPKVCRIKDGDTEITLVVDGQRRVLSSIEAFNKTHEIEVVDLSEEPKELTPEVADWLTEIALTTGNNRRGYSSYELAMEAQRQRNRGKVLSDIARWIDKSESWVSKMLKAMGGATTRLMGEWKAGRVTDEQFKDLAAEADVTKQVEETKAVVTARASGDKSEARAKAKETKAKAPKKPGKRERDSEVELERREKHAGEANGKAKNSETKWEPPPAVVRKSPSKAVLEQMLELVKQRLPTDPYVKGIMDGVRYALDDAAIQEFGAPWRKYMARVGGTSATAPKAKGAKKARKPSGKAKPRKKAKK